MHHWIAAVIIQRWWRSETKPRNSEDSTTRPRAGSESKIIDPDNPLNGRTLEFTFNRAEPLVPEKKKKKKHHQNHHRMGMHNVLIRGFSSKPHHQQIEAIDSIGRGDSMKINKTTTTSINNDENQTEIKTKTIRQNSNRSKGNVNLNSDISENTESAVEMSSRDQEAEGTTGTSETLVKGKSLRALTPGTHRKRPSLLNMKRSSTAVAPLAELQETAEHQDEDEDEEGGYL